MTTEVMSIFSYLPSTPDLRMPRRTKRAGDLPIHWQGEILEGKATVRDAIDNIRPALLNSKRPLTQLPFRFH